MFSDAYEFNQPLNFTSTKNVIDTVTCFVIVDHLINI